MARPLLGVVAVVIGLSSCGSDIRSKRRGEPCTRNGECEAMLVCTSGMCDAPPVDAAPEDAPAADAPADAPNADGS